MLDGKLYEVLFVNVYLGIEAGFVNVHISMCFKQGNDHARCKILRMLIPSS